MIVGDILLGAVKIIVIHASQRCKMMI